MSRGTDSSRLGRFFDDTLVLGLVALAVAAVALGISYRAQNGLPWLATYDVSVDVPDAAKLLKNADVRIGGARVGQVLGIEPQPPGARHPPFTRLRVSLDPDAGPLPADSTAEVRLASVLGGKFLDIVPGTSDETVAAGDVLPLAQGRPGVDQDDAFLVFNPESRAALRAMIAELSGGLAGRGSAINEAIELAARAFPAADRVLTVLVSPSTDLAGFVRGALDAAQALEPLAADLGTLLDDSATTLAAIDGASGALDQALAAAPGATGAATDAMAALRPVLDDAEAVVAALEPATPLLEDTLAQVDATMRAAAPVARGTGRLAPGMDAALRAVDRFSTEPAALGAVRALGGDDLATFGGSAFIGLGAILRTVSEAQLECNVTALWMRNLAAVATEGDSGGNWLRMIPIFEESEIQHRATMSPNLHVNFYPDENADECESGNEPWSPGIVLGNPEGHQSKDVEITDQEWP